ncbi:hypothetical protein MTR67_043224 [Solanum verrucosum]|uniref:Uncharacterized protein n=1 Tax=Solanum verrucosum TaxID=315347 RepID=A0AAF0UPV8_SOLVR|nr:hypothetical protein MTR67_043224 [Solanum verrucosum]
MKLISMGRIYHLVWVTDTVSETPTPKLVLIVNEFLEVFLDDLPRIPPERDINFAIDLISDTQPISIPSHRMAPDELKELKDQLKYFLNKGLIRPSMSPCGAPVLFV